MCFVQSSRFPTRAQFQRYIYTQLSFTPVAPKSVRVQSGHQYLFMLLGYTGAKAAHITLMKSTPVVHFTNILGSAFMCTDLKSAKKTVKLLSFFCFWDLLS